MTALSDRARGFIFEALEDRRIPSAARSAIVSKLGSRGPRESQLNTLISTALDSGAALSARVSALQTIIDIAKGELS